MEKHSGDNQSGQQSSQQTREERLAAKLRENLHRRKAQARAVAGSSAPAAPQRGDDNESGALPKSAPES